MVDGVNYGFPSSPTIDEDVPKILTPERGAVWARFTSHLISVEKDARLTALRRTPAT